MCLPEGYEWLALETVRLGQETEDEDDFTNIYDDEGLGESRLRFKTIRDIQNLSGYIFGKSPVLFVKSTSSICLSFNVKSTQLAKSCRMLSCIDASKATSINGIHPICQYQHQTTACSISYFPKYFI